MRPGPHDRSVPSNRTRGTQMCELWWRSPAIVPPVDSHLGGICRACTWQQLSSPCSR
nr:unnamed protein product [Callosobruchus chinensis]